MDFSSYLHFILLSPLSQNLNTCDVFVVVHVIGVGLLFIPQTLYRMIHGCSTVLKEVFGKIICSRKCK
jgi:hypothetical protein